MADMLVLWWSIKTALMWFYAENNSRLVTYLKYQYKPPLLQAGGHYRGRSYNNKSGDDRGENTLNMWLLWRYKWLPWGRNVHYEEALFVHLLLVNWNTTAYACISFLTLEFVLFFVIALFCLYLFHIVNKWPACPFMSQQMLYPSVFVKCRVLLVWVMK